MLELRQVTKSYRSGEGELMVLGGVDLAVPSGSVVALEGPSGTGKSTLLAIAGLLSSPTSGEVHVAGTLVQQDEAARNELRRRHMAFALQQPHLVPHLTARENVELMLRLGSCLPRGDLAHASMVALDEVGLSDRADHFPSQLSGGEQQRVGVARALAVRPTILLADEPTGSLDEALTRQIVALLADAARAGIAVLVASHDPAVVRGATTSYRLHDGVLTPAEVTRA